MENDEHIPEKEEESLYIITIGKLKNK